MGLASNEGLGRAVRFLPQEWACHHPWHFCWPTAVASRSVLTTVACHVFKPAAANGARCVGVGGGPMNWLKHGSSHAVQRFDLGPQFHVIGIGRLTVGCTRLLRRPPIHSATKLAIRNAQHWQRLHGYRALRGFAALWLFSPRRQALILLAHRLAPLRCLTFELRRDRR